MLQATIAQPLQNWLLCALGLAPEGFIHEAAFLCFRLQVRGLTQVGLVIEHNKKLCLLTIGSVVHHPWRDLAKLQRVAHASARRNGRLAGNRDCPYESDKSGQKKQ